MAVTAYQEKRIRALRQRGVGYRTIAAELGISRMRCAISVPRMISAGWLPVSPSLPRMYAPATAGRSSSPGAASPPILLRHMLPDVVGCPPGGDPAEPGGSAAFDLRVLREGIHSVRQRTAPVLLPQLLHP